MGALATNVGMHWSQVAQKLVSFGAYCVSVCEGVRTRVIVQNQRNDAPFMSRIHCMDHYMNVTI